MKNKKFKNFNPETVLIESRVKDHWYTKEILNRFSTTPKIEISTINNLLEDPIQKSQYPANSLILAKQEGRFFKPCPCTQNHICCGYYFLNIATNCNIGCSYCILQEYLTNPFITMYTNIEDMFNELDKITKTSNKYIRVGTGELTDSLLIDDINDLSLKLIPYFLKKSNIILELKTKTTNISNLFKIKPDKKVIISWSLNPQNLIKKEELLSTTLKERLQAAKKCADHGYLLSFHFDPIIYYPGWEKDYQETINLLFNRIPPATITWISLGTLRYPAKMDKKIRQNYPDSEIVLGELLPGLDGKMRYLRPLREKMLKKINQMILKQAPNIKTYLCMESMEVWKQVFNEDIFNEFKLPKQLDKSAQTKSSI